jgi:hypothetical protein
LRFAKKKEDKGMKKFSNRMLGAMLIVMMAVIFMTATFSDAYYVKQQWARISATCGETITTGQVVTLLDADGYAYKADANDATLRPAVGVAGKGCTSGGSVEIIVQGIFSGWTGLTESAPGFLSETAGAITQVAPSYSQQIGAAISTTDYFVNCQNYFDTSSLTALGADVTITGATPSLTIGDSDDEDTYLIFDGQAGDDFYIAFDTADDDLNIGYGGATEAAAGTQTAIEITDSATPAVTIPNAFAANGTTTLGDAVTDSITITGAIQGSIVLDGTTDDENEVTLSLLDDPSADKAVKLPSKNAATIMISTLTTNDVDVANSIWGISNGLAMGGATGGDGFELQLKPMGDPAADKYILFPVLTNAASMISTLTTNDVNVANSVWGVSNGIAFGGATGANGFETTLSPTDPASDATITIPNKTGTMSVISTSTHDYGAGHADWDISAAEAQASHYTMSNADQAVNAILPSCTAGKFYTITNGSGQTVTFKVTGQTGGSIASAKSAVYMCNGTDVLEVWEQS